MASILLKDQQPRDCVHLLYFFSSSQVKDVLYHLYKTARGNLQRLMPKEIRILKYLLTIEDPEERMSALEDAFTPGEELEGMDVDCLYTYVFEPKPCCSIIFSVLFQCTDTRQIILRK